MSTEVVFNRKMATGQRMNEMSTYVFLHSNTTRLLERGQPCRITEICLLAVNKKSTKDNFNSKQGIPKMPRVLQKLVLCLKPGTEITDEAFAISNLKTEDLDDCSRFSKETARSLKCFLQTLDEPVCLIAHYGKFDFAVLKAELAKAGKSSLFDDIYCADSRDALIEIDKMEATTASPALKRRKTAPTMRTNKEAVGMKKSQSVPANTQVTQENPYSLRPYYKNKFGSETNQSDTAEGFCRALFKVAKATTGFFEWVNEHAEKFEKIV